MFHFATVHLTLSSNLSFSAFLLPYFPSLSVPWCCPVLGGVWAPESKRNTYLQRKKRKMEDITEPWKQKFFKSSLYAPCWLHQELSFVHYYLTKIPDLQITDLSDFSVTCSLFPVHWKLTDLFCWELSCLSVYSESKSSFSVISFVLQMEQMAQQSKHLYVNCKVFICYFVPV